MQRTFLPDVTAELIDAHFNINVRGYLLCAKHAAEPMTNGGSIINVASAISRMAYPGAVVYSATKGAVDVMTRVLAAELGPKGIRVNVLAPGSTRTDMNSEKSGKTKEEERQEIAMTAPPPYRRTGGHRGRGGVPGHRRCPLGDRHMARLLRRHPAVSRRE